MFGGSWRLGRFFGVEVRIDASWLVIAALVTYTLYDQFSVGFPELSPISTFFLSLMFGLLFFTSVLAHEMAHALTAKRRGIEVHGITLFLFGGATHAKVDSRRPQDELVVSLVGPLTSLLLGGLFLLVAQPLGWPDRPIGWGIAYLGAVNVALAVFNMLPGFPLDGGRVLRALVWRATGSLVRATRVASIAGQAVGYLLVAAGIAFLTREDLVRAIWLAAIGWFLVQAARSSQRQPESSSTPGEATSDEIESTPPRP